MNVIQLYHTMFSKLESLLPTGHVYRTRNLAWFLTGLYASGSVHLSKVANQIPGAAHRVSRSRRLSRFLANGAVRVRPWYAPVATGLLAAAAQAGPVRLLIDSTKVTTSHQLLMVAVAYRRRALPIVWTWLRTAQGHSSGPKQVALLGYVQRLLPAHAPVIVLGDSEFTPLQAHLEAWGWGYVLRQKSSHQVRPQGQLGWHRIASFVSAPGQAQWLPQAELTKKFRHRCQVWAYWRAGEKDPWLLATNLPSAQATRRHYKVRMWIEELFGDLKGHGVDLQKSRLRHFLRLSRLTLAVALLYVFLVAFGSTVIKRGLRPLVDRRERRDLSLYRIGRDMMERCLINGQPLTLRHVPYFA